MAKRTTKKTSSKGQLSATFEPTDRVVILPGSDAFLRLEHTRTLKGVLESAHGEVDVIRFDGASAQAADVLDECRTFGLMVTHKLVVVDDAQELIREDTRPLFQRYAESPSGSATLLLRATRWYAGKLDAAVEQVGRVVKCAEPAEADLRAWVGQRAKSVHGFAIGRGASELLVDRFGCKPGAIDAELSKLAVVAADLGAKEVGEDLINEHTGERPDVEPWALQGPVLHSAAAGLGELRRLMQHSPKGAHIPAAYALLDLSAKLATLASARDAGHSVGATAKTLRLWGPAAGPTQDAAQRLSGERARGLLRAMIDVDRRLKGSGGEPERVLGCGIVSIRDALRSVGRR